MSLLHEANRLIAVLQNLNIPAELSAVLDDLTAELVGKCSHCKLLREVEGKEVRQ